MRLREHLDEVEAAQVGEGLDVDRAVELALAGSIRVTVPIGMPGGNGERQRGCGSCPR